MDAGDGEELAVWRQLDAAGGAREVELLYELDAPPELLILAQRFALLFAQPLRQRLATRDVVHLPLRRASAASHCTPGERASPGGAQPPRRADAPSLRSELKPSAFCRVTHPTSTAYATKRRAQSWERRGRRIQPECPTQHENATFSTRERSFPAEVRPGASCAAPLLPHGARCRARSAGCTAPSRRLLARALAQPPG